MLAKKHTATQLWLCSLLIALAVTGSSICVRAGRLQKAIKSGLYEQPAQSHYISQEKDLPRGVHRTVFISQNDDAHVAPRFKIKASGPVAILATGIVMQAKKYFSIAGKVRFNAYACLLRPAYYTFLFRYVLF